MRKLAGRKMFVLLAAAVLLILLGWSLRSTRLDAPRDLAAHKPLFVPRALLVSGMRVARGHRSGGPPGRFPLPVSLAFAPSWGRSEAGVSKSDITGTEIIATVAGTGTPGFAGDGGAAAGAQINTPLGVAIDGSGNLFIADRSNHRIRKVGLATGTISTVAGAGTKGFSGDGGPAASAGLDTPSGLAVDGSGNLFIADTGNHRIRKVGLATGTISTVAGAGTFAFFGGGTFSGDGGPAISAQLFIPTGLAVDGSGNLFIADTGNHRIRKVGLATGTISTVAGAGTFAFFGGGTFSGDGGPAISAGLNFPSGIALDGNGNLFIADRSNHRVREVGASSRPAPTPTPLPTPTPIPIPVATIAPPPQVTPTNVSLVDTRAVVPTTGRSVAVEAAQTVNTVIGRPDTTVVQDVQTGVTTFTVATQRFSTFVIGVAQTVQSSLTREQAAPAVTLDPVTGTATITSAAGIQVTVMGAPPDLSAFLQLLGAAAALGAPGATAAQLSPGQFLLTTTSPGVQLSTRVGLELFRGGGPAGFSIDADGAGMLTYPTGDRQQVFSLFADVASFLAAARAFPGVDQATANLDGTVTVTAGSRTVRVRPDFSVRASPAGSKRFLLDESGAPTFDSGDGRRQRFTILP